MTHRFNLLLVALLALVGLPYYVLLLANPSAAFPAHPVSMPELRRLAASIPGQAPTAIGHRVVAWKRLPGNLLAAGAGIKRRLYTALSFELEVPGHGPILIDTGTTEELARESGLERFITWRQQQVDEALKRASLVVATQEDDDSLGGLAALSNTPDGARVLARSRLNAHQVPADPSARALPWAPGVRLPPAILGTPQALAPGVVAIPTGAPTPGSQMIYVRLANGREYIFAGPVATLGASVDEPRVRSRLMDFMAGPVDRAATMGWLENLQELHKQAPHLRIIPGRDVMWIEMPETHTGIHNLDPQRQPDSAGS